MKHLFFRLAATLNGSNSYIDMTVFTNALQGVTL